MLKSCGSRMLSATGRSEWREISRERRCLVRSADFRSGKDCVEESVWRDGWRGGGEAGMGGFTGLREGDIVEFK